MGKSAKRLLCALASLRLAVVLLTVITGAALAGTLVPQMPAQVRTDAAAYEHWLELTRAKYAGRAALFHAVGLFDVFQVWWFRGLLGALLVNTLACTFRRARGLWRGARLGSLLTHISLIFLVCGAAASGGGGWREARFVVRVDALSRPARWADDAGLRLAEFTVAHYPDGAPRDYRAEIVIVEQGAEVARRVVRVNRPMTYRGATFYLVAYGEGYVELLVVRDPGYGVVIGAAGAMVGGMMVTFYGERARWRRKYIAKC